MKLSSPTFEVSGKIVLLSCLSRTICRLGSDAAVLRNVVAWLLLSILTRPTRYGFMDRRTNHNLCLHLNPKANHIRVADTKCNSADFINPTINRTHPGSQYQLGTKSSV